MFKLRMARNTPGPMDVVIVDFVSSNSFYEHNFDPNNISPPACFAISPSRTAFDSEQQQPGTSER